MANVLIDESRMTNIANALRLKTGTTAAFTVAQMPSVISNINTTFTPNLRNLEIYPSESSQAFSVASGYDGYGNITVYPIASDYIGTGVIRRSASDIAIGGPQVQVPKGYYSSAVSVAFPTAEHPAPTISFNSSTGIITATHSQSTGYTNGGATAANLSLAFQSAITITPGSTSQIISGNLYLGGDITIDAIPSTYVSDPYYNIYKSLAFRSVINGSDPYVSEWADSLSNISTYSQFAGQCFNGSFYFNNLSSFPTYTFAFPSLTYTIMGETCSANFYFPTTTSIRGAAFAYNSCLTSIQLPECVNIDGNAFYSCANLSYVFIPKVTSIGNSCFWNCSALENINIPKVATIGSSAFQQCSSLTEIDAPECLSIGSYCFSSCTALTSANLPKLNIMERYAFYSCSSLSEINLPMISSLGDYAFNGCVNLHTVSLSGTISSIGIWTFANCSKLLSVYLNTSSVIKVNTNAFIFTPISGYPTAAGYVYGTIYVPSSLYSSYLTATGWSVYSSRLASF